MNECTLAVRDQGRKIAGSQALFRATGFIGVSEPEEIEDVEEGERREVFVVSPNGKPIVFVEVDVVGDKFGLDMTIEAALF